MADAVCFLRKARSYKWYILPYPCNLNVLPNEVVGPGIQGHVEIVKKRLRRSWTGGGKKIFSIHQEAISTVCKLAQFI